VRNAKLVKMYKFEFLRYVNRVTIRTFKKDIYILKSNLMVKNVETDEVKRLEQIYYDIRTVRTISGNPIAKRKNPNSDLYLTPVKPRVKAM